MARRCVDRPRSHGSGQQRGRQHRVPHQRVHRRVEGRGPLAPRRLAARDATRREGRRDRAARHRRDVRPVPHGRLVLHRERAGRRPPGAPRRRGPIRRAPARRRALARQRHLLHPRGVATHPRVRRRVRHLVARRGADRHVAGEPRPDRCAEGAVPGFVDVGGVRLHRDGPRRRAPRLRSLRPAGAAWASRRRWWSPTSPTTASCGSAAPRCSPATSTGPTPPPTPSTPTAGSTPATSSTLRRRWLLHHHRTPLGVDPLRRRVGRAGRGRDAPSALAPVGRRRGGGGPPRCRAGARSCRAAIVVRPGATLPTVDELRTHVAATLVGPEAAARRWCRSTSSRARTPPGRYAGDASATPSRRASGPSSPGRASRGRRGRLPARRR